MITHHARSAALAAATALSLLHAAPARAQEPILLRPARVWDGEADAPREGWVVLVRGSRIAAAGPASSVDAAGARVVELPGATLLPGLIDAHSHLLLHPYDETSWEEQVLKEPLALRVARATKDAERTLHAGWTAMRDLGSEGAGYADVGLKQAIERGIVPGPRLQVATRAIVATGSYGPKGFDPVFEVPQGAEEASGMDELARVVRDQIGKGADWIKVYADYRWGPGGQTRPTFTLAELEWIVEVAASAGVPVVAHASSPEGMRRAALAGVRTIEHGDGGTPEVFRLMAERGVALCPTLAAGQAIERYQGWRPGEDAEPVRVQEMRRSFRAALDAGVTLCGGSDVGVFPHGEQAREVELMADYGMRPVDALRSVTSVNARVLGWNGLGVVRTGATADLIAVDGDPTRDVRVLRSVRMVMKGGTLVVAAYGQAASQTTEAARVAR